MDIVLILLAVSTLIGAIAGLRLKAFALAPIGVLIALASAVVLRTHGFGFKGGVATIVGCLVLSQLAYFLVQVFGGKAGTFRPSMDDIADGDPGRDREKNVDGDHRDHS